MLFFALILVVLVESATITYDVTCVTGPNACGSGGKYTLTKTGPDSGPPTPNANVECAIGDTLVFNFPVALPAHPFLIWTQDGAPYPSIQNFDATYPYSSQGSVSFQCDDTLMTVPAVYICQFHEAMTGRILLAGVPTEPTEAPNSDVWPGSTTNVVDVTSASSGYVTIELGERMSFHFKRITASDTFLDFAIRGPTSGWLGIGFSRTDNYQMKGSDAFIGAVFPGTGNTSASSIVRGYLLATKALDTSGIIPVTDDLKVYSASGSLVNGFTTIAIRRKLTEGFNPIVPMPNGQIPAMIIASYCIADTAVNYKHDVRVEFGQYVDLRTGQSEVATRYAAPIRIAHGICMGTAYALFFPLGLIVARYGKGEDGTWFKIHFFLQNYAFLIMLAGVIIGYTLPDIHFQSFTYHGALGTAIFICTVIQVAMGFARPHKEKGQPVSTPRAIFEFIHHWLGRAICIMAIAQIAAGIRELGAPAFAYGIWVPFVVTFFLVSIALEIRLLCCQEQEREHFYELLK